MCSGSSMSTPYILANLKAGVQYNISVIAVGIYMPSQSAGVVLNQSEFSSYSYSN